MSASLVEALDDALRPYMSGDSRRRFVCERIAPVIGAEILERLGLLEPARPDLREAS